MGKATSHAFLFENRFDPELKKPRPSVGVECRRCGTKDWGHAPNPGWGRRIFKNKGWIVGNTIGSHTCPLCAHARKKNNGVAKQAQFTPERFTTVVASPFVVEAIRQNPIPGVTIIEKQEQPMSTTLAEGLAPLKEKIESRTRRIKSKGQPSGFAHENNAGKAARAVLQRPPFNVEHPSPEVHYRTQKDSDGTFSYVLLGFSGDLKPTKMLRKNQKRPGDAIVGTHSNAKGTAESYIRNLGLHPNPKEGVHYTIHRLGHRSQMFRLVEPKEAAPRPPPPPAGQQGHHLSAFDARKAAIVRVLAKGPRTDGAPREGRDYWLVQDAHNWWGYTLEPPVQAPAEPEPEPAPQPEPEPEIATQPEAWPDAPPPMETPVTDTFVQAVSDAVPDPTPPAVARRATPAENRRIMEAMEAGYDIAKRRYTGRLSDSAVAEKLGVPRVFVSRYREDFCGGPDENESVDLERRAKMQKLDAALSRVDQALRMAEEVVNKAGDLETLRAELRAMRVDIGR